MKPFYCAAPWRGLHINPQGKIKTCCAGAPNLLGDLHTQTIEQVLNGPEIKEIRNSLKNGVPHKYCFNCVAGEAGGADSERAWHNRANPDFDIQQAGLDYEYPVIVDIRWNTTCNLSCSYCDQMSSSRWAALKKIPFKSDNREYYHDVCDFLHKHQSHVKEVALIGGEPFLLNENFKLLDVIPNETTITLITNLSVDLENNKIFQKLSTRSKVGWSMSFENVGPAFEYVRYGANWNKLLHNLDLVQNLMKSQGQWGGIHAVYNLFSATRLCELQQFALDRGLTILWQNLHYPLELDPRNLGPRVAKLAQQEIINLKNNFSLSSSDLTLFDHIYQQLEQGSGKNLTDKFQNYIVKLETEYHPDKQGQFAKIWPELHQVLFAL